MFFFKLLASVTQTLGDVLLPELCCPNDQPNYHNVLCILYTFLHEAAMSKRFITMQRTCAADGIFELSLNIFGFSHMSQACDPRPACASQLLSVHSLASLQLGSI